MGRLLTATWIPNGVWSCKGLLRLTCWRYRRSTDGPGRAIWLVPYHPIRSATARPPIRRRTPCYRIRPEQKLAGPSVTNRLQATDLATLSIRYRSCAPNPLTAAVIGLSRVPAEGQLGRPSFRRSNCHGAVSTRV